MSEPFNKTSEVLITKVLAGTHRGLTVIQQFVALGQYFMRRDKVLAGADEAQQYAQDPAKKFGSNVVYVLVFSNGEFQTIQVEEYSAERRQRYLYRPGPPNGFDATPTTGLPKWRTEEEFTEKVGTRLKRLARSLDAALSSAGIGVSDRCENEELGPSAERFQQAIPRMLEQIKARHADPKQQATLTLAWRSNDGTMKWVGDYELFRQAVVRSVQRGFAGNKTQGTSSGQGQCSICAKLNVEVSGGLKVPNFKFYTLDKRGSVSGGFDPTEAWRNFPACNECCEASDYAGERVKASRFPSLRKVTVAFRANEIEPLMLPLTSRIKPTLTGISSAEKYSIFCSTLSSQILKSSPASPGT